MKIMTYCEKTKTVHEIKASSLGMIYTADANLNILGPWCLLCNKPMVIDKDKTTLKDLLLGKVLDD